MNRPLRARVSIVGTVLSLLVSGCATPLHSIPAGYEIGASGQSVVIGRTTFVMAVKPVEFFDKLARISVFVENIESGEHYEIVCDQSGSDSEFFVVVPPGQYAVSRIEKGNLTTSFSAHFTVAPSQVIYIGNMKFLAEGFFTSMGRSILAGQSVYGGEWVVEDDFENAVATLGNRSPQLKQTVQKSLLVIDR